MKISVVIPVYNIEDYLSECLDSIVNQSLEDIEIICVNDGSTDGSLDILKEYESKDSRVKIISQENKGIGNARNTALEYAKGEYVYFIDGDDTLELDALERLYDLNIEKNADFIIFKISNFNGETGERINDEYYTMPYLKDRVGEDAFNYFNPKKQESIIYIIFYKELIQIINFRKNFINVWYNNNIIYVFFKSFLLYEYNLFSYLYVFQNTIYSFFFTFNISFFSSSSI